MARHSRRIEHSGWVWFKEFIAFIYNHVLSYFKLDQVYKDEIHIDYGRDIKPQSSDHMQTNPYVKSLVKQEPHVVFLTPKEASSSHEPIVALPTPTKVIGRYKPLVLPLIFQPLPAELINKLPSFNEENSKITADQHVQKLEDVLELYEIEEFDVRIRIFSLSLQGNAKSWFKNLLAASIFSFHQFARVFLDRWAILVNFFSS